MKSVLRRADVPEYLAMPKALRHALGIEATERRVSLSLIQKWLGHAKLETTLIYATPIGKEERALARHTWIGLLGKFDN